MGGIFPNRTSLWRKYLREGTESASLKEAACSKSNPERPLQ